MFYIFWTNVSKIKYIKCCDVKRMFKQRYLYADSTTLSILQVEYKAEIRKTINILRLTKNALLCSKKACKLFSASSVRTNSLIWRYVN